MFLSLPGQRSSPEKDQRLWIQEHQVAGPWRLCPPAKGATIRGGRAALAHEAVQPEQSLLRRRRTDVSFSSEVPSLRVGLQALAESSSGCWQGFGNHRQTGCPLRAPLPQVPAVECPTPPPSLMLVRMRITREHVRRLRARCAVWFSHLRLMHRPDPYFVGEDTEA